VYFYGRDLFHVILLFTPYDFCISHFLHLPLIYEPRVGPNA
jgi:hypothetical protein